MKVKETIFDAKTGKETIIERELTEQEIAEKEQNQLKFELNNELNELTQWFTYYDNQVAQYNRCQRLGVEFDNDINELDNEATQKQLRIREINAKLKEFQTKS